MLTGTGGTSISNTFDIKIFFQFCIKQMEYIFVGLNSSGEAYLNGISRENVCSGIYVINFLIILIFIAIFFNYMVVIFKNKIVREAIKPLLIMVVSMGCLIVASSTTIRVEMRWLYCTYAIYILTLVYMISIILKFKEGGSACFLQIIFFVGVMGSLFQEGYYRQKWDNLYYWGAREISSSIAEVLGPEKDISKVSIISEERRFFAADEVKTIMSSLGVNVNEVEIVENIAWCDSSSDLILYEDHEENRYIKLSNLYAPADNVYCISGISGDGWAEKESIIKLNTLEADELKINCNALEEQEITVYINGVEQTSKIKLEEGDNSFSVFCEKQEVVEIKLVSDYEKKLAYPDSRVCSYLFRGVERITQEDKKKQLSDMGSEVNLPD